MKFKRQVDEEISVNLTPLIDVVFLLLIFFMVSTTFTKETKSRARWAMTAHTSGRPNRPRDALVAGRHTVGQARQNTACRGLTKGRNNRVDACSTCRNQKPKCETCGSSRYDPQTLPWPTLKYAGPRIHRHALAVRVAKR